ncbi:MAG: hypothetical protein A3E82_03930 [Gammaproteobacteria bacterium RIFCSPHIGHO2_12_FULL_38_11]|nr:MAG: hypothetical protein A3E82_03930 [Gammaproteobacteria bacterium RIFCSPHIGHO2_12_FULL_38_11]
MKRKILWGVCVFIVSFFSFNVLADQAVFPVLVDSAQQCAVATDYSPTFCSDFKIAVTSCCPIKNLPMQKIYHLMMVAYGDLQNACNKNAAKYGGSIQSCVDQWNCYWNGGSDSQDRLCSTTGVKCETQ